MKTHELKTWPEPFASLASGDKTCELRRDDRGFAVGDELHLREYAPAHGAPGTYTGRELRAQVTHVQRGFGLHVGYVALSVRLQSIAGGCDAQEFCGSDCDTCRAAKT